jgi:putative phage-type endonuclease
MEELFNLPIDVTRKLNRKLKWIAREKGVSYTQLKRKVVTAFGETALGEIWERRRRISRVLKLYGQADQRSDAWLQKRSEMITASEVTKAFASASPSARKELLLRKVNPSTNTQGPTMTACLWGTQFEPIAKKIYESIQGGAEVVDTTCVVHPTYPFLGASPDGIVFTKDPMDLEWGKLVEFKCPISRAFTQTSAIPDSYYHQMQMQMECTGIHKCDYVEMQFKTGTQTAWRASTSPYKGVLAVYDNGKIVYMPDEERTPNDWKKTLTEDDVRVVFWTLENIRVESVQRDVDWLSKYLPDLQAFWAIVQECRADPSKTVHYTTPTAPPDAPSAPPAAEPPQREPPRDSSPVRTMILNLDEY